MRKWRINAARRHSLFVDLVLLFIVPIHLVIEGTLGYLEGNTKILYIVVLTTVNNSEKMNDASF